MYIPTYIDIPMLFFSFGVGCLTFRMDHVGESPLCKQFAIMVVSLILSFAVSVINRNETRFSVPLFVAAAICVVWAIYLLLTRPAKLSNHN